MNELDQKFVLADLKRTLAAMESEKSSESARITVGSSDSASDLSWVERVDQCLLDAEQGCIARESVTAVNPHRNMNIGSAPKRFIKRVIRKMILWFIQPIVIQQSGYNCLNNDITTKMRDSICMLKDILVRQHNQIAELSAQEQVSQRKITELSAQSQSLQERIAEQQAQIAQLEQTISQVTALNVQVAVLKERTTALEKPEEQISDYLDYARFEEKFRGSQAEIRERIRRYLDYFTAGSRVVDLGCGRGEWLELLKSIGAEPVGVDLNESTVGLCRKKGLTVERDDLFHYLEQQPDDSLDGVTAIQVIEHLTPVQLARLTQLCYRKLKFGGHVIFETQNPAVVSTMTTNFFIDPTHLRPVHPIWARYVLEDAGFSEVALDTPQYAWVTDGSIPPLEISGADTQAFNQRIAYLNNLLYGSTDYAVIGVKR